MLKHLIVDRIIDTEGGYVYNPNDSGGETNYGITVLVARENGYQGNMRDMPRQVAFDIYASKYWDSVRADDILKLSESVAHEVVDTAVNMGPKRSAIFLQRSLAVLTGLKVSVDGIIGAQTINALKAYFDKRDDSKTLLKALNCLQGNFYIELSERREKDRDFIYGWLKNRV
jgi:lysozyme family protein